MRQFFAYVFGIGLGLAAFSSQQAVSSPIKGNADVSSIFKYQFFTVPETGGLSCDDTAKAVADKVAKVGNINVLSGSCVTVYQQDTTNYYDIEVSYVASAEIVPVVAVFSFADSAWATDSYMKPLDGDYYHDDACFADIPSKEAEFQAQTGLQPVVSYCYAGGAQGYALEIVSFGTPKLAFFSDNWQLAGYPDQALFDWLTNYYKAAGAYVSAVRQDNNYTGIRYYAAQQLGGSLRVDVDVAGGLPTNDVCVSELSDVQAVLQTAGISQMYARCLPNDANPAYVNEYFMNIFYGSQGGIAIPTVEDGPEYSDLNTCLANRAQVFAQLKDQFNFSSGTAVCGADAQQYGQYKMTIIGISK